MVHLPSQDPRIPGSQLLIAIQQLFGAGENFQALLVGELFAVLAIKLVAASCGCSFIPTKKKD